MALPVSAEGGITMLVRRKSSHGPTQLVPQFDLRPEQRSNASSAQSVSGPNARPSSPSRCGTFTSSWPDGFFVPAEEKLLHRRECPDQRTTFPSSPQRVWDSPCFFGGFANPKKARRKRRAFPNQDASEAPQ